MIIASSVLTIILVIGGIIVYHWWARKKINGQKLLRVVAASFVLIMMFWSMVSLNRIADNLDYIGSELSRIDSSLGSLGDIEYELHWIREFGIETK